MARETPQHTANILLILPDSFGRSCPPPPAGMGIVLHLVNPNMDVTWTWLPQKRKCYPRRWTGTPGSGQTWCRACLKCWLTVFSHETTACGSHSRLSFLAHDRSTHPRVCQHHCRVSGAANCLSAPALPARWAPLTGREAFGATEGNTQNLTLFGHRMFSAMLQSWISCQRCLILSTNVFTGRQDQLKQWSSLQISWLRELPQSLPGVSQSTWAQDCIRQLQRTQQVQANMFCPGNW